MPVRSLIGSGGWSRTRCWSRRGILDPGCIDGYEVFFDLFSDGLLALIGLFQIKIKLRPLRVEQIRIALLVLDLLFNGGKLGLRVDLQAIQLLIVGNALLDLPVALGRPGDM